MKKLLVFISMVLLFSCEGPVCEICTIHQTSYPIIPAWERTEKFEICDDDENLQEYKNKTWTWKTDSVIYITTIKCESKQLNK